jgi:hypothetical protein
MSSKSDNVGTQQLILTSINIFNPWLWLNFSKSWSVHAELRSSSASSIKLLHQAVTMLAMAGTKVPGSGKYFPSAVHSRAHSGSMRISWPSNVLNSAIVFCSFESGFVHRSRMLSLIRAGLFSSVRYSVCIVSLLTVPSYGLQGRPLLFLFDRRF